MDISCSAKKINHRIRFYWQFLYTADEIHIPSFSLNGGRGNGMSSYEHDLQKKKFPQPACASGLLTNLFSLWSWWNQNMKLAIGFPYWLGSGEKGTTNESETVKCRKDKRWHVSFSLLNLQCCCNDTPWKKIDKEEDLHPPANFISADIGTRPWTWKNK